ncbi:MAG: DUF512 domain-containing protein [Candidatus Marinimicrobia bacterium]|nr:DUF512 domain-containing protein [Candidatus Neomarinimicrobiota bacterium]
MIKIINVKKDSLADNSGVGKNDHLVSLNGHAVNDLLDYYYYQSEEVLDVVYKTDGKLSRTQIEKSYEEDLGLEIEDFKLKSCSNNCVFCFIKQNPPKMRNQVYFCDEDYRYSFLYGNYITLTDMNDTDLKRIVEQRLSPLYISVHATDPDIRKSIFRFKSDDRLMEKIEYLVKNRIELHTQLVLVPGMNDGDVLKQTINDLYKYKKMIKSLAVVPVGLTRHRKHLPAILPVSPDLAADLVRQSEDWNRVYQNNEGDPFVYLSDEFYLLAEKPFPGNKHYGPYCQLENGVGLCRQLIDSVAGRSKIRLTSPKKIGLITGKLAEPVIRDYVLPYLNRITDLNAEIVSIENNFFGNTVTVSGLLTGGDIIGQFPQDSDFDCIFLPPNCINEDGFLLDDLKPEDISRGLKTTVKVGDYDIKEMVNILEE